MIAEEGDEDDDDGRGGGDDDTSRSNQKSRVTAHAKNPNRLNVGITRAKSGLVVFGQVRSILDNVGKWRNALTQMVTDAHDRNLIFRDFGHLDTHPTSIAYRKQLTDQGIRFKLQQTDAARLRLILDQLQRVRRHRVQQRVEDMVPFYRTPAGDVTRVSGPKQLRNHGNQADAEAEAATAAKAPRQTPRTLTNTEYMQDWIRKNKADQEAAPESTATTKAAEAALLAPTKRIAWDEIEQFDDDEWMVDPTAHQWTTGGNKPAETW